MSSYEPKPTDADIAAALDDLVAMPDEVNEVNKRGPKTTIIHFRAAKRICATAKEGYVATLNRFIEGSRLS